MAKMQKISLVVVLVAAIGLISYLTWQRGHANNQSAEIAEDNSDIIFFFGQECPHCQAVEKYITDHQIDQKVTFSRREVYHNRANVNLMLKKSKECGLSEKEQGSVPLLWAFGKCYLGEYEAENFLDAEASKNSASLPVNDNQPAANN